MISLSGANIDRCRIDWSACLAAYRLPSRNDQRSFTELNGLGSCQYAAEGAYFKQRVQLHFKLIHWKSISTNFTTEQQQMKIIIPARTWWRNAKWNFRELLDDLLPFARHTANQVFRHSENDHLPRNRGQPRPLNSTLNILQKFSVAAL